MEGSREAPLDCAACVPTPRRVRPDRGVRILPERAFIISTVTAGARARDLLLPRITLISHNVLIEWFPKVKSPTKTSIYCFNQ